MLFYYYMQFYYFRLFNYFMSFYFMVQYSNEGAEVSFCVDIQEITRFSTPQNTRLPGLSL